MGHSMPWDVLRVGRLVMGRLVMGRFENGTFQELDLLYVHLTLMEERVEWEICRNCRILLKYEI
jgi:hypothetical protein